MVVKLAVVKLFDRRREGVVGGGWMGVEVSREREREI